MFEKLVVTIDESPDAEKVLPLASSLANRCHAGLTVVSIDDAGITVGAGGEGKPAEGVGRALIMMANPGPSESSTPGGAVGRQLLDSIRQPVLLVPAGEAGQRIRSRKPLKFLVVLRDLPADAAVLDAVVSLSQAVDAHLTLLNIVEPVALRGAMIGAQSRLDRVADRLREQGRSVATVVEMTRDPSGAISDRIQHGRYDLVAVSRGGSMMESDADDLADAMIRIGSTPVLLVHE